MNAATVTVSREALLDLLHESHAVCDTMEAIAGVVPSKVTEELLRKAERVAEEMFGPVPEHDEGARGEVWDRGRERSQEFLESLLD